MPYKSNAQRAYFHAAMKRGEIKPKIVKEYDEASKGEDLPEYVSAAYGMLVPHYSEPYMERDLEDYRMHDYDMNWPGEELPEVADYWPGGYVKRMAMGGKVAFMRAIQKRRPR